MIFDEHEPHDNQLIFLMVCLIIECSLGYKFSETTQFIHRMEIEADYIGLLLIASAGYDPRVAPKVYEKLGKITGESTLRDYLSTHPSGKKRAELLAQAKIMEEAFSIYRDARAGHGVEGFL